MSSKEGPNPLFFSDLALLMCSRACGNLAGPGCSDDAIISPDPREEKQRHGAGAHNVLLISSFPYKPKFFCATIASCWCAMLVGCRHYRGIQEMGKVTIVGHYFDFLNVRH